MMTATMDRVERLTQRRARVATAMGVIFIGTQAFRVAEEQLTRPVDYVQTAAWILWVVMLVAFILFGGAFWRGKSEKALLNDEGTEQNRRTALIAGFWAMLAAAAIAYALSFYEPLSAREALHFLITIGVGATLLRFGMLERQALKP